MNAETPRSAAPVNQAYKAFYDAENDLFVVDFTGRSPFAKTSLDAKSGGMFTHNIFTDREKGFKSRMGVNKIGINGALVRFSSESLSKELRRFLETAVDRLSRWGAKVPEEAEDSVGAKRWRLRCATAAQLLTEHQAKIVNELVASYSNHERSERS